MRLADVVLLITWRKGKILILKADEGITYLYMYYLCSKPFFLSVMVVGAVVLLFFLKNQTLS